MSLEKPYIELTFSGKLRRLGRLAATAIHHYGLEDAEIRYHSFDTNLHYRVTTAAGERYMLRLASPGWRTNTDLLSEALWLDALARDTDVPVPQVMPTRTGDFIVPMTGNGITGIWNACLMSWVPGRRLDHYLIPGNLRKMGELFAVLHHHGATWVAPAGFTQRRFEHWLSRGEPNLIIRGKGGNLTGVLPAHSLEVLERMHQHVEAAYAQVNRSDLRIIHCDLWHGNIKLHHGLLHPLDFEDTIWGFRAHDIAMGMLDLLEATDDERYPGLLAAFREGYEYHMPWTEDRIEPFQIGRLLWTINWVVRFDPKSLANKVERYLPVFEHYERTGRVILPAV